MAARIEGADQLRDIGKQLRAAGEEGKALRKELLREVRGVAKGPLSDELKQAATSGRIPKRGGLAAYTAKNLKVGVRTRLSGREVGVTALVSVRDMDLPKLEQGKLRHPTFGHGPWVNQTIRAGVFSDAAEQVADDLAAAVLKTASDIVERI
jgi:hypothetical protein